MGSDQLITTDQKWPTAEATKLTIVLERI